MNNRQDSQDIQDGQHGHGDAVYPPSLTKTGRDFLADARKPRPVFLPLKTCTAHKAAARFCPSVGWVGITH